MADMSCLDWPFFEPRHGELAHQRAALGVDIVAVRVGQVLPCPGV